MSGLTAGGRRLIAAALGIFSLVLGAGCGAAGWCFGLRTISGWLAGVLEVDPTETWVIPIPGYPLTVDALLLGGAAGALAGILLYLNLAGVAESLLIGAGWLPPRGMKRRMKPAPAVDEVIPPEPESEPEEEPEELTSLPDCDRPEPYSWIALAGVLLFGWAINWPLRRYFGELTRELWGVAGELIPALFCFVVWLGVAGLMVLPGCVWAARRRERAPFVGPPRPGVGCRLAQMAAAGKVAGTRLAGALRLLWHEVIWRRGFTVCLPCTNQRLFRELRRHAAGPIVCRVTPGRRSTIAWRGAGWSWLIYCRGGDGELEITLRPHWAVRLALAVIWSFAAAVATFGGNPFILLVAAVGTAGYLIGCRNLPRHNRLVFTRFFRRLAAAEQVS